MDEVPLDGRNLIIKAFQLFREQTGQKAFFRCDIDKQTPLEGGMGGGSSNCATALWAANKLCGSPASNEQLIEWGGKLGSDVSFFLSLGTAYCTGRGELIENIPSIPTPKGSFWVVKPAQGCPTGQVYGKLGLSPGQDLAGPDPVALRDKMLAAGLSQDVCVNDLELPAQQVLPKLAAIKDALKQGGFHTVLLSGSGNHHQQRPLFAMPMSVKTFLKRESPDTTHQNCGSSYVVNLRRRDYILPQRITRCQPQRSAAGCWLVGGEHDAGRSYLLRLAFGRRVVHFPRNFLTRQPQERQRFL